MISKKELIKNNIELIPISDLNIELDPNETIAYDLTVDDYFTFCSHDGIFVQDTN